MNALQTDRADIRRTRLRERPVPEIADGQILARIDRFGYSSNNVTYAAAGDTLGYWRFFPTEDDGWGLVPVWGYAQVEASRVDGIEVGERLFGYWPPASHLVLEPTRVKPDRFLDATPHRAELPAAYNLLRRVEARDADAEDRHALLSPLYLTSWCLADALRLADWHGAERVVIASASSKTAIGLAFALLKDVLPTVALTSPRNADFVRSLDLYDETLPYDDLTSLDRAIPTVIVDMSGDAAMLGRLHAHLGDAMRRTLDVGLTHWQAPRRDDARDRTRSEFFFAPSHIQSRIKEWGAEEFAARTDAFMQDAIEDSRRWMQVTHLDGLEPLGDAHAALAEGKSDPAEGIVVEMRT